MKLSIQSWHWFLTSINDLLLLATEIDFNFYFKRSCYYEYDLKYIMLVKKWFSCNNKNKIVIILKDCTLTEFPN